MCGVPDAEPAVVCPKPECAAEVRRDWPSKAWVVLPLQALLVDLAVQYGPSRRSWRCTICRSSKRADIDRALVAGITQRQVAAEYGFAKGSVANHALGHLPVTAMVAAGR
jgi:hypothetical protein